MDGLRPLRVGEILDASIKLYLRNWRVLMGASALVAVPLRVLGGILFASAYSSGNEISTGISTVTLTHAQANARIGATAINGVLGLIIGGFVVAACTRAISETYLGQEANIGSSLRFALRRLGPLIVVEILYALGIAIAFVCLVIPGIWLYASWAVAVPVLVIEGLGPFRSLGRSRRLVRGHWFSTAAVLLVANVMIVVLGGVLGALLGGVALGSNPTVAAAVIVSTLSGIVVTVLLQPFSATVYTVLYYDLRIRRDGYDIELLAEQLGLPQATLPGASSSPPAVVGPESVGQPGGPPFWPPPPGWTSGG